MSLKKTAWWTTIACLSVLLSTVGSAAGKMSKTSASSTIVITMNPQGYTPIVPTKDNPHPSTMLGTLAKQYEALHPNVQIQFLPSALVNTLSNPGPFITRANAGDAPDVAWAQENMVNSGEYPQGLFIDLRPYLRRPDPYIRGNKHWIDAFNPAVIAEVTAPSGAIYVDSAEYIAAGMMYNKAAFAKARITAAPHTFADLLSDEVKLQKAGYWPTGCGLSSGDIDDAASWWEREAMSSFFQEQLSAFNANHTTYETNGLDYAVAVKKGLFRMTNPRYAEVWKLLKTWSQHWEPDPTQYAVMPPSGLNASATWLLTPFLQNKLGIAYEGTWAVQQLDTLGFTGKFGVFPFPNLTKATTPYAGSTNVSLVVSGPTASWQYYISTPKADHSMTATKLRSVIDWLMFISTPQHSQEVINQVGTTIPTMNGTKPLIPSLRQLIPPPGFKQPVIVDGVLDGVLTPAAQTDGYKLLQSYLNGQLSWSAFAQQWDRMLDQQVAAWAQANHTDLSKYLK